MLKWGFLTILLSYSPVFPMELSLCTELLGNITILRDLQKMEKALDNGDVIRIYANSKTANIVLESLLKKITRDLSSSNDDIIIRVHLSLAEALQNAVKWGSSPDLNGGVADPTKVVTVNYRLTPSKIRIEISDQSGRRFQPRNPLDPAYPFRDIPMGRDRELETDELFNRRSEAQHDRVGMTGGRGVNMMEVFCDSVEFTTLEEGGRVIGTRVELEWNLPTIRSIEANSM